MHVPPVPKVRQSSSPALLYCIEKFKGMFPILYIVRFATLPVCPSPNSWVWFVAGVKYHEPSGRTSIVIFTILSATLYEDIFIFPV